MDRNEMRMIKDFADYLMNELAVDLVEDDLVYTAGDVREAALTIKKLLKQIEQGEKQ